MPVLDFQCVFEQSPVPLVVMQPEAPFIILAANDASLRATQSTRDELVGRPVLDIFPDLREPMMRVIESKTQHASTSPIIDAQGQLAYITHRIEGRNETTDREQAEYQFRALIEAAPDSIVVVTQDGTIVLVNSQTEQWFGYTREELVGQPIEVLIPQRFRDRHQGHRSAYVEKPRSRPMGSGLDLFGQRKNGSEFPVEISLSSFDTEDGTLVMSIVRDLTERRHAEQMRTELQARFEAVAETAKDVIVTIDSDHAVIYVNPAAEPVFGASVEDLIGIPFTHLLAEPFHAQFISACDHFVDTSASGLRAKRIEMRGRNANGLEFPIELSLANWNVGEHVFYTVMLRDVTERKVAEQALRDYAAQLEVSNRELEAFSYSVSHDLRAPLRSIDGFSQALLEDYSGKLDDVGIGHLNRVRAAAQRMGHLIDDLLTLARVTRIELKPELIDLSALASDISSELQKAEPARKGEFEIQPALTSRGDARLLRVALENLLGNAWKFTGKKPSPHISFGLARIEGAPTYFVRDNGAGFDMTYSNKLFSAFQRLHDAHDFPGTGVGLATVQRVIQKHGGKIWADAAPNRGATFYFVLPD